jgi:hypothetical protein
MEKLNELERETETETREEKEKKNSAKGSGLTGHKTKHETMFLQKNAAKRFGEHVGKHTCRWDMNKIKVIALNTLENKMIMCVDVLSLGMMFRILGQFFGNFVIKVKRYGCVWAKA